MNTFNFDGIFCRRPTNGYPALSWATKRLALVAGQVLCFGGLMGGRITKDVTIEIRQLTHTEETRYSSLSLSADGSRLAFLAGPGTGESIHEEDAREIWLWTEDLGFRAITNSSASKPRSPVLSGGGYAIAFISLVDLTGDDPRHYEQVFLWKEKENRFLKITDNPTLRDEYGPPQINASGDKVAFVRFGPSAFAGEVQLWSEEDSQVRTLSTGMACSMTGEGDKLAFLDGPAPLRHLYIWSKDSIRGPLTTDSEGYISNITMSAAGTRISFRGGVGADDSRVFMWIEESGILLIAPGRDPVMSGDGWSILFKARGRAEILLWRDDMLLRIAEAGDNLAINGDGRRIAFTSDLDLTGENPSRWDQIFIADITTE